MVLVDDNKLILTYIVDGKENTYTINYTTQMHLLNSNTIVTKMTLGNNLSVYGYIVTSVNNQTISIYKHFTGGIYEFNPPIAFLTFHMNKVN